METSQLTTWVKPPVLFITGSIAYTNSLFHSVKCTILALPWSLNECADAVSDESLDGLKVWWCGSSSSSSGFEGWWTPKDVILARWWLGEFSPRWRWKRAKRNISWHPRIFDEWKVKGSNLRYRRFLAHILIFSVYERNADWQVGHWYESFIWYRGHYFRVLKSQWCLELLEGKFTTLCLQAWYFVYVTVSEVDTQTSKYS